MTLKSIRDKVHSFTTPTIEEQIKSEADDVASLLRQDDVRSVMTSEFKAHGPENRSEIVQQRTIGYISQEYDIFDRQATGHVLRHYAGVLVQLTVMYTYLDIVDEISEAEAFEEDFSQCVDDTMFVEVDDIKPLDVELENLSA